MRDYYSCVLVDFYFRGIPQRVQGREGGHYTFGGRVEVKFKGYVLNEEEVKKVKQKIEEKSMEESLKLVEGVTEDSLAQIKEDIDHFLEDTEEEEEEIRKKNDVNPFSALLGLNNKKSSKEKKTKKAKKEEIGEIKKDSYEEDMIREYTEMDAKDDCFSVFDTYKKAHGMMSHPGPGFWNEEKPR
mgnify:FL=1